MALLMESKHLGCPGYRAAEIEVDFMEEHKIFGIRSHRQILERHIDPRKKSGKTCDLKSAILVREHSRTEHKKKPCNKSDAPAELC